VRVRDRSRNMSCAQETTLLSKKVHLIATPSKKK